MGAIQQSILSMIGATTQAVGINKMIQNQNQVRTEQKLRNATEANSVKEKMDSIDSDIAKLDEDEKFIRENDVTQDDLDKYDLVKDEGWDEDALSSIVGESELKAIRSLDEMSKKRALLVDQKEANQKLYDYVKNGKITSKLSIKLSKMRGKEINNG